MFKPRLILGVVGSFVFLSTLTHCALLHSVYDLKIQQMNVQRSQIRKRKLYDFELLHNSAETVKNIC